MSTADARPEGPFYHGTRADLRQGDVIAVGHRSNFGTGTPRAWVYFSATMDAAVWGAELAAGEGRERVYVVEPTGAFFDDPNLTDKKYPGNPTRSYRSREPLRIVAEVLQWDGHPPERLKAMKDMVERSRCHGDRDIID